MDKDIKLQDLHLHCRACLCGLQVEIKYNVNTLNEPLTRIFKECAGKIRNKFYPKYLCAQCFEILDCFHNFQEKTKETNEFLEQLFKSVEDEEFLTDTSSIQSAQESEASLEKSEIFEAATDTDRIDNDPLQEAELISVEVPKEAAETNENKSDFDVVSVKVEVKETDEAGNVSAAETSSSDSEESVQQPSKANKCRICDEFFVGNKKLREHMQVAHQDELNFQCDQCKRSFNRKSRLKLHQQKAHGADALNIVCKFGCGKVFQRTQAASKHYRLKHTELEESVAQEVIQELILKNESMNVEESALKTATDAAIADKNDDGAAEKIPKINKRMCTICFSLFSNNTALRKHLNTHKDVRPFQCDKCERGFNCNSRLQKHVRELHSDKPVEFLCKFGCGKVFKTSDSAGNHYRRQHSGKEMKPETPTCICEDCGRVFKCMTRLKQHSYQHRPIEDRPYQCEVCQKRFVFKKAFNDHQLRHKGIKEFSCPQCGLKKTTKQEVRNHMKYHTDELKVSCPICSKIFGNAPNLRRHIALVHEGVKNFKCQYCDEAFGKAETLKHHEMRHTGEKPHKCEICEKSFIQLVALRTHMKTHNKLQKTSNKIAATAAIAANANIVNVSPSEPTALMGVIGSTL